MFRIACLAAIVLTMSAAALNADEKSHRAAVEELLVLTKTPQNMKSSIDQILDLQIKQAPMLASLKEPMRKFFEKHLSYESLKEDLITMYVEEFSEDEVRDLIKFYQTPLGKKSVEKMPVLFAKGAQLGAAKVEAHKLELQQLIRDELLKP
jgi:hypothetical protein